MSILLAGGAGYIGSHTAVELTKSGYEVVIVDNYDNSCPEVINRIERITGTRPEAYEADVRDKDAMPYISQVAVGRRKKLTIFGNDYPTADGTCRRDYIHISDLADGHVKAVDYAMNNKGVEIINLGTGTPYSVLEIVNAFEDANGIKIPYEFGSRREGDLPEFWANADKAKEILGWEAKRNLADMCRDTWNWQKNNPNGYR